MKMCVALLCGTLLLLSNGAQADEVDDLLAGRTIGSSSEPSNTVSVPSAEDSVPAHQAPAESLHPTDSLKDSAADRQNAGAAWRAGVPAELPPSTVPAATTGSAGPLSLVPEPSAIALAGLALLYFLVFFHRRQLA